MTQAVTEEAHAKLNLTLEILGRRPDGYHEIASVMQTIDLHDNLTVRPADDIKVECDNPSLAGEANLAHRAAEALRKQAPAGRGALITITKRIPVAAGLGGGSSDAAAALRALNRLWELGLPLERLAAIGTAVGSDVPFLVHGGAAHVRGRGEQVTRLPPADLGSLVLLCPDIQLEAKTSQLFDRVTPGIYTTGGLTSKLAARIRGRGDVPAELMFNAFNALAPQVFPGWTVYRDTLASLGAREIMLAGAGPSMFARVPRKEIGTAWQLLLEKQHGWKAFIVNAWSPPKEQAE
ncbi:MAG: 4-(cytidine 5'-diphospho)-2-C-methyl-D-erythritol kinase [Dehalococcoidia bacterium]|nr:4-(cytidine 5'-diphospho)-2-C-methyl-D-erythritol kinase [Dehalococcoidia bacterium]